MPPNQIVPDNQIVQKVQQQIARVGTSAAKAQIKVACQNGQVTLSGTVQHASQRQSLVAAARMVPGVRRVVDQLRVETSFVDWK